MFNDNYTEFTAEEVRETVLHAKNKQLMLH